MSRKLGIFMVVLGVLLVAGAGVIRWVVAPQMAQLPGDTNTTRIYTGTASALSNPTSTTASPVGPGILRNVPIEVRHTDTVVKTSGHAALVADSRVVTIPGYQVADLRYRFSVDRRTFMPVHTFAGVAPTTGLTFNWPMNSQPRDYTGWIPDTGRNVTLHYVGTVQHAGLTTYEYTASAPDRLITDPVTSRNLPPSQTKADMLRTTPSLGKTTPELLKLDALMKRMPDPVPLAYTYRFAATFWIAPVSGVVVDHQQREVRTVNVVDGARLVPIAPVMAMSYRFSPMTVAGAAGDARKAVSDLHKIRVTVPLGALVLGVVLIVAGSVLAGRRRRTSAPPMDDDDDALTQLLAPREPIGV